MPCRDAGDEEEATLLERLRGGFSAVTGKLADWGVLSPRLMLAGGGLFMTLSNWGLLPSVGACHTCCHAILP